MALRDPAKHALLFGLLTVLSVSGISGSALAAIQAGSPTAAAHIVDVVDETKLIVLAGHTLPVAGPKYDRGAVIGQPALGAHVSPAAAQPRAGSDAGTRH